MSTLRVVNLGLPKTGTTSLARALKIAGYRVADHRIRPRQTQSAALRDAFVADLLYRGYFDSGDPGALFEDFNALTELSCLRQGKSLWPQMDFALIDAIRRHHPQVLFLASRRDSWDVSQSMLAWSDLGTDRLPASRHSGSARRLRRDEPRADPVDRRALRPSGRHFCRGSVISRI